LVEKETGWVVGKKDGGTSMLEEPRAGETREGPAEVVAVFGISLLFLTSCLTGPWWDVITMG